MRKFIIAALFLFALHLGTAAQTEQIVWEKDFKQAQVLARESGRPLLLDFTASWCKPCQMMEKTFWVLPEVVSAMKPFIAVKVDYDNQKGLAGKYNVGAIPFVAFTDPLGNLITFRRGLSPKNVEEINQIFNQMPKDFSAVKNAYDALEVDKNDGDALLKIADFYNDLKLHYLSNDFYKRALKTDKLKNDAAQKERIAYRLGANYFISRADAQAVESLADYLKDYPADKNRETILSMLAISNARLGKEKETAKYLDLVKKEFPESKNISAINQAVEEAKKKPDTGK